MTNREVKGVLDSTGKTGAENFHSRVWVEGVLSARFSSNPTAWLRILTSFTNFSVSLTNNSNSRATIVIDYYLKYRQDQ